MPRPVKCRRINYYPPVRYFKPAGIPLKNLEEACLTMEEMEAIRLKDLEGLEQKAAAERMNISRPTFQRVLAAARQKIAAALIEGKAIRIQGGNFEILPCHFRCRQGHEWDIPFESIVSEYPQYCPICRTVDLTCSHQSGRECENGAYRPCCQLPAEK